MSIKKNASTSHICTQEKEITELRTNGKWMMEKIEKIDEKVNKVHDDVSEIKNILTSGNGKISVLNKAIFGNESQSGVIKRLSDVEAFINEMKGIISFIKWISIVSGLNLLAIFILIVRGIMNGQL